ncbi:MAG: Heat-inducible transcription repressor HrcA [Elusimicrobia bacterium]|nr:Heat-inducible transcription repressor HrcA [Elusimicrobiota bacterium]
MRILPSDEHHARKEKMLQAVVHLYIKTGKPVGSSTIAENFKLNLSPATIRNVMAELEKEGFLTHPHTSAGRIPTDRGYRFYVDSIAHVQKLAMEEEKRIRDEYARRRREIEDLMLSTTRLLSMLSNCTGFVLPGKIETERLRRLELIPVSETQILGVLVSDTGFVRNQMIDVSHTPDEETLRSASRYLNQKLAGLSFTEAQQRVLSELDKFHRQESEQMELMQSLSKYLFGSEFRKDIYVEGANNIWKFPEMRDVDTLRNFAHFVDEKEALGAMLTRGLVEEGLQVRIGSEYFPEMKDFSVVSSGFQIRGRPMGVLGILGPKRMEYHRMMAIVNTVANIMNKLLEGEDKFIDDRRPHA